MNRRESRETVLGLLFEMEYHSGEEAEQVLEAAEESREFERNPYIRDVFFGAVDHLAELDAYIEKYAIGWKVGRIAAVTRAILRLAIYEMVFVDSIPVRVSVDEAVELAKRFDVDDAPKFINGVLNAVLKSLDAGGRSAGADEAEGAE